MTSPNLEQDTIHDWDEGSDRILIESALQGTVSITYSGSDTIITFGTANEVTVLGTVDITMNDIFFA